MGTSDPFDVLKQMRKLKSKDPKERGQAVLFLGKMQHQEPRAEDLLRHVADTDPDHRVRELAQKAIQPAAYPNPVHDTGQRTGTGWSCIFCGTGQITTDTCPNCGAERASRQHTTSNPASAAPNAARGSVNGGRWTYQDVPFLFKAANRDYILGKSSRLGGTNYGCAFVLLIIVLGVAVGVFVLFALPGWNNAQELKRDGVTVTGTVIDRRISEDDEGSDSYYVRYRFQVGDTDDYRTKEQIVSYDNYRRWIVNTPITVRYLPRDPSVSELLGDNKASESRLIGLILSIAFITIVAIIITIAFELRNQDRMIATKGQVLRGEILSFESHLDTDDDLNINYQYRFVTPTGREIVKRRRTIANELKDVRLPRPGHPVAIVYLNDKTHRLL